MLASWSQISTPRSFYEQNPIHHRTRLCWSSCCSCLRNKETYHRFDINRERIQKLRNGIDRTGEVTSEDLANADILFTDRIEDLRLADFHIVAVPTPVDEAHQPDLTLLLKASNTVGKALKKGDIVVYESTVYPGVTEDECVPVLEKASGLSCGKDFTVGYSPERINPGDREHSFTKIKKVVS